MLCHGLLYSTPWLCSLHSFMQGRWETFSRSRNVGKKSLICVHDYQPWILASPSPTRAKKGWSQIMSWVSFHFSALIHKKNICSTQPWHFSATRYLTLHTLFKFSTASIREHFLSIDFVRNDIKFQATFLSLGSGLLSLHVSILFRVLYLIRLVENIIKNKKRKIGPLISYLVKERVQNLPDHVSQAWEKDLFLTRWKSRCSIEFPTTNVFS